MPSRSLSYRLISLIVAGDQGGERCRNGETKEEEERSYVGRQKNGDNERDSRSVGGKWKKV